jgi:hypothetical protein
MRRPQPCTSTFTISIDSFLTAAWRSLRIGLWSRMDISFLEFLSHHSSADFARCSLLTVFAVLALESESVDPPALGLGLDCKGSGGQGRHYTDVQNPVIMRYRQLLVRIVAPKVAPTIAASTQAGIPSWSNESPAMHLFRTCLHGRITPHGICPQNRRGSDSGAEVNDESYRSD